MLLLSFAPFSLSRQNFHRCLFNNIIISPNTFFTQNDTDFIDILDSRAINLRFTSSKTPQPVVIFIPSNEAHIQAAVICTKKHGIQLRIRSGGHDYEGASYASAIHNSFVVLDLSEMRDVNVNTTDSTVWIERTLEQNATKILYKWQQVASKLDENLFIGVDIEVSDVPKTPTRTILTSFYGHYLGEGEKFKEIIINSLPELGVLEDYEWRETSWLQTVLALSGYEYDYPTTVLSRKPKQYYNFKAKSDFVTEVIPEIELETLWKTMMDDEKNTDTLCWPEASTPFPHRNVLFNIQYVSKWLDAAWNQYNGASTSYEEASSWGTKYFKDNFKRRAQIKIEFDPDNFFRHEQSIPILSP
ncbi:hypothetical protein L1987_01231 [Smallanthus sonchifolius]|uniref:Uncharacterized protein n=1 Tax=Smallanthus sonchifolius TaxID=185202 RepID=A0ACB9K4B0_9ASTR|nr:hypothetical protein L1987_01231 [Smallanthus sonchifolius]